jgi:hypothetical protein
MPLVRSRNGTTFGQIQERHQGDLRPHADQQQQKHVKDPPDVDIAQIHNMHLRDVLWIFRIVPDRRDP